jgi:hypothetical protein
MKTRTKIQPPAFVLRSWNGPTRLNEQIKLCAPRGTRGWVPVVDLTAWNMCGWATLYYESRYGCPGAVIQKKDWLAGCGDDATH